MKYPEDFINKIICGDCLEVMKDIPDKSIDMILADLPYGTTACKWDTCIPFEPMWEQLKRVAKKNGAIVLFGSQPFTSALVMSNPKMFRYMWVWDKEKATNFMSAKLMPLLKTEDIIVFSKATCNSMSSEKMIYNPQGVSDVDLTITNGKNVGGKVAEARKAIFKGTYKQTKTGYPKNILKITNDTNKLHPTQKPVALMEYLIKTYTNEGDLVLDNVAGSGTTGVACKNTNRNYILIEKEPEYCKIAEERLSQEYLF